ncbi:hypothetical protein [Lyngbya aestuarii]|uniref:hypothetical protein n=1 Tax=Lyngbya aestuarii TaxID=118322 RepID=UPI0004132F02|nr:hypothetical protein [Lyngbya aestuarii]
MNNYLQCLIDVLPALIGFLIAGCILRYFIYERNSRGILYSSLGFILSGFITQTGFDNYENFKNFIVENKDLLNFPIVSTVLALYLVNKASTDRANKKERRETSILFVNAINSQVDSLNFIQIYFSWEHLKENQKYIDFYLERFKKNEYFITAFNKIGIYDEFAIDLISRYFVKFEETLTYIERLFIELNFDLKEKSLEEEEKNKYIPQYRLTFIYPKISITITLIFAALCIYFLDKNYKKEDINKVNKRFLDEFQKYLQPLREDFQFTHICKINQIVASALVQDLKYVREKYKKISRDAYITNPINEEPIYIIQILFNDILISQILSDNLILQERYRIATHNCTIVTFGRSEIEARQHGESLLKSYIDNYISETQDVDEQKFQKIIQYSERKIDIISPWG